MMIAAQENPGASPGLRDLKAAEVWDRLGGVVDPELDEPVTELNFVTHVDVGGDDHVRIGFRLPTYWCAPNFAFMMVDDMRAAVCGLPWVRAVSVELGEHMYADTINDGVAAGKSFQESFGDEADGDLDEVRRTFLLKAFQRRQEALILHLLSAEIAAGTIIAMSIADLRSLDLGGEGRKLVERYMQRRAIAGPFASQSRAFVTSGDDPLEPEGFEVYVKGLRRVRVNAEFNGALCRGLLAVRFDTTPLASKQP